jgi:AcrR family transcriptional regulator
VAGRKKGRRAPKPEERQRDAERSRRALLDAALVEFAAKGLAGARVSEIADRAGVNRQLISYYFDGKDGLYQALVEHWLAREEEFGAAQLPFDELVARYVEDSVENRELHRLFVRESLEDAAPVGQGRVGISEADVADLRRRQRDGEIADDLDPAFLLLALQGAVSAGITFPDDVRRVTGLDPASPEFAERYAEQLRRIVRHLMSAGESSRTIAQGGLGP